MTKHISKIDQPTDSDIKAITDKYKTITLKTRAVADAYKVSDSTARKWIKYYERNPTPMELVKVEKDYTFSVKCNACGMEMDVESNMKTNEEVSMVFRGFKSMEFHCKCGNHFNVIENKNEIESCLKGIIAMCNTIKSMYQQGAENTSRLDKETQDLLHEIELSDFENGDSFARELQFIRRQRRENKDLVEMAAGAYNYLESIKSKEFLREIQKLQENIKFVEKSQNSRKYNAKVRDDLTICNCKPQIEEEMKGVTAEMQ